MRITIRITIRIKFKLTFKLTFKILFFLISRYIATQGPLKETSEDFWQMVWEQRSPLIIMVTPLEEKGRKKCHKYWPDEGEELVIYGLFRIVLTKQSDSCATIERQFRLTDCKV